MQNSVNYMKVFGSFSQVIRAITILLILATTPLAINAAEVVNINKANAATMIENWKGIGEKKAKAIVAYRNKNGNFSDIDDLMNVTGIGEKLIKNNRKYMSVSKGLVKPSGKAATKTATKASSKTDTSKSSKSSTNKSSNKDSKSTTKAKSKSSTSSNSKSKKSSKSTSTTSKKKKVDCKAKPKDKSCTKKKKKAKTT